MTAEMQTVTDSIAPVLRSEHEPMLAFSFLLTTYELSSPATEDAVPIWDVGSALGLQETVAEGIASDLQEMNLICYSSLAGDIALTSFGVSEIVLARSLPQQPTTHFPPLAVMSEQMVLPLANLAQTSAAVAGDAVAPASSLPDDFSADVNQLADQLESFSHNLQGSQSAAHLDRSIDKLERRLNASDEWPAALVADLEQVRLELMP